MVFYLPAGCRIHFQRQTTGGKRVAEALSNSHILNKHCEEINKMSKDTELIKKRKLEESNKQL